MLFAGGRRDLESLKLGMLTFDRVRYAAAPAVVREATDSCIRLLGKRRRIDTFVRRSMMIACQNMRGTTSKRSRMPTGCCRTILIET